METIPVIAVAFGTSTEARDTYAFFEECFRRRYPETELAWAFTSRILREKVHNTRFRMNSLDDVLQRFEQQGYKRAVVQSLHIIPGIEFKKITDAATRSALKTAIGMPLLSTDEDIANTLSALADRIPATREWATVLVGHGTHHPAGKVYQTIERILKERSQDNILISVVEGEPRISDCVVSMPQNNPYDDFLKNISRMVEDIIKNIPDKEGTHFIGYTIIAGKPGENPHIIPMDKNPGEEIEYEVIENEDSLFVTGKLPPHTRSAAYADISADGATIVVGERKASIPLDVRIDVIHSYYQIRHGVIDIVLKKKKT